MEFVIDGNCGGGLCILYSSSKEGVSIQHSIQYTTQ